MKLQPVFVSLVLLCLFASSAQACWWCRHHGHRHHHGGTSSPSVGSSTVAQQPNQAVTTSVVASPIYYYPMGYPVAPVAQTPSGLFGSFSGGTNVDQLIGLLQLVRDLRKSPEGGGGNPTLVSPDLTGIQSSITELREGQAYLRGQLINNAGILRDIGEEVVEIKEEVVEANKKLLNLEAEQSKLKGLVQSLK